MTALTVLSLAGPAGAASGQVTRFSFHGTLAEADWFASSATRATNTFVSVSKSQQGSELFVDQLTSNFDANGNFTGATDTSADVTSGFSVAIARSLASASLTGSGLPATACTFDANFNRIGCSATTIDVAATWTGQGPISRGVVNHHFKSNGFNVINHFNGATRAATATGTAGGLTLSASELQFADLDTANSVAITVCISTSC